MANLRASDRKNKRGVQVGLSSRSKSKSPTRSRASRNRSCSHSRSTGPPYVNASALIQTTVSSGSGARERTKAKFKAEFEAVARTAIEARARANADADATRASVRAAAKEKMKARAIAKVQAREEARAAVKEQAAATARIAEHHAAWRQAMQKGRTEAKSFLDEVAYENGTSEEAKVDKYWARILGDSPRVKDRKGQGLCKDEEGEEEEEDLAKIDWAPGEWVESREWAWSTPAPSTKKRPDADAGSSRGVGGDAGDIWRGLQRTATRLRTKFLAAAGSVNFAEDTTTTSVVDGDGVLRASVSIAEALAEEDSRGESKSNGEAQRREICSLFYEQVQCQLRSSRQRFTALELAQHLMEATAQRVRHLKGATVAHRAVGTLHQLAVAHALQMVDAAQDEIFV